MKEIAAGCSGDRNIHVTRELCLLSSILHHYDFVKMNEGNELVGPFIQDVLTDVESPQEKLTPYDLI